MAGSELYAPLYYLYSTARPIALAAPQRCRRLTSGGRRRKGWLGARQSVSRHRPTARRALRQAAEHAAHSGDLRSRHPADLAVHARSPWDELRPQGVGPGRLRRLETHPSGSRRGPSAPG